MPTEYKTKNATFEAGYQGKTWSAKLSYLNSKFSSGIDTVQWANFYTAGVNASSESSAPGRRALASRREP